MNKLPVEENMNQTINDIVRINTHIRDFWKAANGWAPTDAAKLLSCAKLDWQVSLSHSLKRWLTKLSPEESDGCLILAWANLGSLVEGTLKWFLSVRLSDYSDSPIQRGNKPLNPDSLPLGKLLEYYESTVWIETDKDRWSQRLDMIRERRNAIHSYQDRELGVWSEFWDSVALYREFLLFCEQIVPYPDEFAYPADIAAMNDGLRWD